MLGPFALDRVTCGDARLLVADLPDESVHVVVTSPPYWGQRLSDGTGVEPDPRAYLSSLVGVFVALLPKLAADAAVWLNLGDAYNTPVNWRLGDGAYSTLGADGDGLPATNAAYVKPRYRRRAFLDGGAPWLRYGNLLALPYRLVIALCDAGYLFRGELVWHKRNPLPEGRCRRPHRQHESIYLLAKREDHAFRRSPPVGSVWTFANERIGGLAHRSRFPEELPRRCIEARGDVGRHIVVLDPFCGSGTTGIAALRLGCSFVGFEIDGEQAAAANGRLAALR